MLFRSVERLAQSYQRDHEVILYEAAIYPFYEPIRRRVRLCRLARAKYMPISTLYVPPLPDRPSSPAIRRRLGWN